MVYLVYIPKKEERRRYYRDYKGEYGGEKAHSVCLRAIVFGEGL